MTVFRVVLLETKDQSSKLYKTYSMMINCCVQVAPRLTMSCVKAGDNLTASSGQIVGKKRKNESNLLVDETMGEVLQYLKRKKAAADGNDYLNEQPNHG